MGQIDVLGNEIRRHFLPGFMLVSEVIVALHVLGIFSIASYTTAIILWLVPAMVAVGALVDWIGHMLVPTADMRERSLRRNRLTPMLSSLVSERLESCHLDTTTFDASNVRSLAAFLFCLSRTAPTASAQKYEDQFSYFEFNRALLVFILPSAMGGIAAALTCALMRIGLQSTTALILLISYQSTMLGVSVLFAAALFHSRLHGYALKMAKVYFANLFTSYEWVTTALVGIALGMLLNPQYAVLDPSSIMMRDAVVSPDIE